jgi:hypothetical protein
MKEKESAMRTSELLKDAWSRIEDPAKRCKQQLAVNSMGMRTHPMAEDIERLSSIGSLLRSLGKSYEDGSPARVRSVTQKLFYSNAWSFLTGAAQQLGFKTTTDLDEFGNDQQLELMWEIAISTAVVCEAAECAEV